MYTWDYEGLDIDRRPGNVVDFATLYRKQYKSYDDLLDEAREISSKENSRDYYVNAQNLRITPEGIWSLKGQDGQERFFIPTSAALASFCTLLAPHYSDDGQGWSASTVGLFLNNDPQYAGGILMNAFEKCGGTFLFRTYKQNIKAVRSNYCAVDNIHVLEYMKPKIEKMGYNVNDLGLAAISPEKMRVPLWFGQCFPEGKDKGPYKRGIELYNDETGLGGIGVRAKIQRGRCTNSISGRVGSSVSHSGLNDLATRVVKLVKVGAMVDAADDGNDRLLKQIPKSRMVMVPALAEVFAGAGKDYGWGVKLEQHAVNHSEHTQGPPTAFHVVQGLTHAAHSYKPKNDSQISSSMAWDLEDLAGKLLETSASEFERLAERGREIIEKREMQEVANG